MRLLTTATTTDEAERAAKIAILPVGSFEQHGPYLPLITDTVMACAISERIATDYPVLCLPPLTISCSHEHADFAGTVSIGSTTLYAVISDIASSLKTMNGIEALVIVNGHGGNYVLRNYAQEASAAGRPTAVFPGGRDWITGRKDAGIISSDHDDMHAGELETSVLLHVAPELVRTGYESADHLAERPHLLTLGMREYTKSGVIGMPSLGTAEKGRLLLDSLSRSFREVHDLLSSAEAR